MRLVPFEVVARAPLAFPERKPGVQFRTSLPYVPGAAIYGALGMLLGPHWQGSTDEFAALFRGIRCHNAYPTLDGDPWVRPLPMTAIQPKKSDNEKQQERQLARRRGQPYRPYQDSLYGRVCWEQQQPATLIYAPTDAEGRAWEAVERSTFYTLEDAHGQPWISGPLDSIGIGHRNVTQRVLTRVSINRRRGTAEDQRLYSPLVINEVMEGRDKQLTSTRFRGSIAVPEGDQRMLAALQRVTHIGGRQTTGIGAVTIYQGDEAVLEDEVSALKGRVATMIDRFKQQAELYRALGGRRWRDEQGNERETPGTIFTIDLLSDAILLDQGWLPANELSAAMLKELTGIEATLVRSFTTTTTAGGWNVSWQRPKPTAVATTMGSVFVFQAPGGLTDDNYKRLADLQREGIGERRAEGYGQVRICDEFHLLPLAQEA